MNLRSPTLALARSCVLVVDDDEEMRQVVGLVLSPKYRVRFAVDGPDGCEKAIEEPKPDLIVADVSLPGLDGFAMIRRIRANLALRRVRVIFFTGQMSTASVVAGLSVGPFAYISKTSAPGVLEAKVRRALEG